MEKQVLCCQKSILNTEKIKRIIEEAKDFKQMDSINGNKLDLISYVERKRRVLLAYDDERYNSVVNNVKIGKQK